MRKVWLFYNFEKFINYVITQITLPKYTKHLNTLINSSQEPTEIMSWASTRCNYFLLAYPKNPFRSIYACKRMPSAYPDDR